MIPGRVPNVVFHTRVRNPALDDPNPFEWKEVTTADIFAGRSVVLFAVPGAFTPACSDSHLPGYERLYDAFVDEGIDEVACLAVNDAFVMFQWARSRSIEKVFMLPDGNGDFTRQMGMLVLRTSRGMGMRSWRYAMHVENCAIRKLFIEPGFADNAPSVGLQVSDAETMLAYLKDRPKS